MTTVHTPGPWHYSPTAGHHDFIIYSEAAGGDVALVRDFHEGNARLIAKAPDLKAKLSACLGFLASHTPNGCQTAQESAWADAFTAADPAERQREVNEIRALLRELES